MLARLLTRYTPTVALCSLERTLAAELDLRAKLAAVGRPSPNQRPPEEFFAAAVVLTVALVLIIRAACR